MVQLVLVVLKERKVQKVQVVSLEKGARQANQALLERKVPKEELALQDLLDYLEREVSLVPWELQDLLDLRVNKDREDKLDCLVQLEMQAPKARKDQWEV